MAEVVSWGGDGGKVIIDDHSVELQTLSLVDRPHDEVWSEKDTNIADLFKF